MRRIIWMCGLCLLAISPLVAQDTTVVRRTADGFVVNFTNQPISVVLTALAAAAGISINLNNVPARNTTLNLAQPLTRDELVQQINSLAQQNGLTVTQEGAVTRIGVATQVPAARPAAGATTPTTAALEYRVLPIRLKYGSAAQLAPVLQSLLGGAAGRAGTTTTVGPNGAVIQTTPTAVPLGIPAAPQAAPAATGGRGGAAAAPATDGATVSDNVTFFTPAGAAGAAGGAVGAQRITQVLGNLNNLNPQQQAQLQAALGGAGGPAAAAALAQLQQAAQQAQQPATTAGLTLGQVTIIAEPTTNALLIRATQQDFQIIQQLVQSLDVRPPQVLIEVTIAEVTRTHDYNVGISGVGNYTPAGQTTNGGTVTVPLSTTVDAARDFILQITGGGGTTDFNTAIHALTTRGDTRVLSMPVIIAQNNRQAVLNVGQRRPFVQVSQSVPNDPAATVQTVTYLDVGTTLTITPTINPDGYVNLVVAQTANSATNEVAFSAPVLSTREATTQVFIRDGQTVVIGGLAQRNSDDTREGIPLLSRIPILGSIFGATKKSTLTSELYIFLTPHVMVDDQDVDLLRDAVRKGSEQLQQILPDGPVIQPEAKTIPLPPAAQPAGARPAP